MNTSSEVGGVLARIADGLPRTPDAEGYRRLFTQAANHLLPLAHPPNDLRHAINSRRDARSSINASRERRHENKIRRSLYRETISRRWEKLQMNESSGKGGTPADMIVGKLKSRLSRKRGNSERIHFLDAT